MYDHTNEISKDTSETGRIKTQKSKGKVDKHILKNNKITGDKAS